MSPNNSPLISSQFWFGRGNSDSGNKNYIILVNDKIGSFGDQIDKQKGKFTPHTDVKEEFTN